jgi:hypothetical protein
MSLSSVLMTAAILFTFYPIGAQAASDTSFNQSPIAPRKIMLASTIGPNGAANKNP